VSLENSTLELGVRCSRIIKGFLLRFQHLECHNYFMIIRVKIVRISVNNRYVPQDKIFCSVQWAMQGHLEYVFDKKSRARQDLDKNSFESKDRI